MQIPQRFKFGWHFKGLVFLLSLALLIAGLYLFFHKTHKLLPIDDQAFVILTLGDDVMDFEDPTSHKRWPDYLQDAFDKVHSHKNIVVLNRRLTSLNTYGLLERVDRFIESDRPNLVIVQIGRLNLYNRFGFGTFQFPFLPNPPLPRSLLRSDTRDKFEINNPLNLKFKSIFSFCFTPELKGDVKAALEFLQAQKELSSEALTCLGNIQRIYLKDNELAFDSYLQAWKKKTNLDLSYDALEPFFQICHSSQISNIQKVKCLWNMSYFSPVFWDSEYAEKNFQTRQHLCDWIEKDITTLAQKLKKKMIPSIYVKYPTNFKGSACDVNWSIEKVAQNEKIKVVSLPETLGLEKREMPEQTAKIVFKEINDVH